MKKRLLVLTLAAALVLLSTGLPAGAYSADEKNTADALYQMGLFEGYGTTYGLDNSLNRYEGYVLMIRMLGEEAAAEKCTAAVPFTDVDAAWAKNYVAYAYTTGLTKGVNATHFGGTQQMNAKQFATICLRSLGYDDSADGEFAYEQAVAFAQSKGIEIPADGVIDRGDCVGMLWDTLNALQKDSTRTLAQKLISKGVFTAEDFANAQRIEREGISEGDKTGEKGTEVVSGGSGDGARTPHQHRWDSGKVTKAPTCMTAGVRTYTCSGCGETVEESIPATGHVLVADAAVAATCTAAGKTAGTHCSVCGTVITPQETIPMLTHKYEGGVCIYCGAKDPNAVVVCTHEHVTQKETKSASCEADGVCTHTCEDCHATWTTAIPALGHTPVEDKAVAATCTTAGKTAGSHCSRCGAVLIAQQAIPALGHTAVEDAAIPATCTTAGKTAGSHCITCGAAIAAQQMIPALGHNYADGVCTRCGAKDPNAVCTHAHATYQITTTATCTGVGVRTYTCPNCGTTWTEEIPALGHNVVTDPAVPATATTTGLTAGSHCSRCGKVIVPQQVIPATGGGSSGRDDFEMSLIPF